MRAFLEAHVPTILRLAKSVVRMGGGVEPEDVAQEVIVRLMHLNRAGTFDPARIENPEAYLRIAVRNAAHRARARRGVLERGPSDGETRDGSDHAPGVDSEPAPTPEEATQRARDCRRRLEALKARLRPRDATAFALLVEEGLDIDEVAQRLGTTANNVYQMRHRILTAARELEQEEQLEPGSLSGRGKELTADVIDSQKGAP
jgi:RNA polymerase sigma factor (sigma-70 family)